jgi:putative transposase
LGLTGPVPARVPAEVKELVLKTVDDAVAAGFAHTWACSLWQVSDERVHRWRARRRAPGTLVDKAPGGHPVHALLPQEIAAILDIAERWGPVDRSHRKLAHRGSYEHLVWVSPSTFCRVLVEHGLSLPEPAPRSRSEKRPWPDWLVWAPNRIWIWDATHFTRARRVCFAVVDLVSRKWIDTLVSVEETATQVQVLFEHALEVEGLLELLTDERLDLDPDDPRRPILLAVSDNGPPMTARDTRAFMALMAIAQHHGRPGVPLLTG